MLVPLVRAGEHLFDLLPIPLDPRGLLNLGWKSLAGSYAWALAAGAEAWSLAALPVEQILYAALLPLLITLGKRKKAV